ncbi:UDP-glucose 4-epimerase GalE [Rubrobacter aplysinae]|uniref:UDP-glucose 4-epimerase GalE n=1 Tax=Rubrobacter aplysinae TaxID=909625 RepID=UPI00064BE10E|nr:UDP-glucose 4-epimerase GalE [Rubrobacter aplysinae]
MRLLVTGGAGYVGSIVAARLLDAGHEVTVLDDLSKGHEEALPEGARLVQCDLLERGRLERVVSDGGFDGVLHFAARSLVGESVERPEAYYRTNVTGSLNLLEAMILAGVRRLVFSSTAAVYGEPAPELVPIHEDCPEIPTNPYGATKLAVDRMIYDLSAAHGMASTSLRYFNVAGASSDGVFGEDHEPETHLIPLVLQTALGRRERVEIYGTDYPTDLCPDGTAVRDYIHVEDLARAHVLALESPGGAESGEHRVYNLGNGSGFSVRQVIEEARRVTGEEIPAAESPRRAGDPPVLVASSERIHAELGWRPEKPRLQDMISDAWSWFRLHPGGYPDRGGGES